MRKVSSSPHIRSVHTTQSIMFDVIIALLPTTIFGIYNFGIRAFLVIIACIVSCLLTEYLYQRVRGDVNTTRDGSAILTGLLLGLNLSSTVPIWLPILGGVFAIIIVKQLFGGIGKNFMNPALGARCFLLISFPAFMTDYRIDGVTCATPLAAIESGERISLVGSILGTTAGSIGETSVVAILGGAIYLVIRKVISLRIPLTYIVSFVIFVLIYQKITVGTVDGRYIMDQLCNGGLMLGACFMATDYVTSPITPHGKVIFGLILGILTGVFRIFGSSVEGVSYAIICGNLLVPMIERCTIPVPFGKEKRKNVI